VRAHKFTTSKRNRPQAVQGLGDAVGGQEPGQFMYSRGIAVDGQGTVYVADTANKRLERLMIVDFELIPPPPPAEDDGGA
jgi:sugar lactone lactonase YvrE